LKVGLPNIRLIDATMGWEPLYVLVVHPGYPPKASKSAAKLRTTWWWKQILFHRNLPRWQRWVTNSPF